MKCLMCDRDATARGLCLMHYKRERTAGRLATYEKAQVGPAYNRMQLKGQRFGRLLVVAEAGVIVRQSGISQKRSLWECECDCGNRVTITGNQLTAKKTSSCGCLKIEVTKSRSTTHGLTETRAYRIWQAMKTRCSNPSAINYMNYGGRGISVCARWKSFDNFISDMGFPLPRQSIERINNDGNYEPSNCRWASRTEQSRNKRTNRIITFNGTTKPLIAWAETIGIDQSSLRERLANWPLAHALTTHKFGKRL